MRKNEWAAWLRKIFMSGAVLALVSLAIWYSFLPVKEYEAVPNQIEDVLASEDISASGISQTVFSKGDLKGIRVRWATHGTKPVDPVFADLIRLEDQAPLETVAIPAAKIIDNQETDILFSISYPSGEYMIRLTCPNGSRNTVGVWESVTDYYREGSAFDSNGQDEKWDWSFNLLSAYPASMRTRHRIGRILNVIFLLGIGFCAMAWIFQGERLMNQKRIRSAVQFLQTHADPLLIALLILIPTTVYLDFLLGDRRYIFSMLDRGADSVGQTYPFLLNTASRIQKGLWGELFNFQQGMGDAQAAIFPTLTNWVTFFGEANVAYLMGVSQWLKVVCSGLFAWLFIKEYGAGASLRFVLAIGYCFNSMLMVRGAWESYPNISMLLMLWLYSYERKLNGKGWLMFLFSSLFMFVNLGLYDCMFHAVLLSCYMLIRRFVKEKTGRAVMRLFFHDFAFFAVFSLLGMMDVVRYSLIKTVSSSRLMEGVNSYQELTGEGIFTEVGVWMSAFLRTIGLSINGILHHTGPLNLLEGPAFYTGIAAMLVAPVSMILLKKKKKGICVALFLCAICYIAIVPLRFLASGFAKDTFKLSSFWITLVLLISSIEYFSALERREMRPVHLVFTGISALVVLFLLFLSKMEDYVVSDSEYLVSLTLVIVYLILIALLYLGKNVHVVKGMLVFCAIVEAMLVPHEIINARDMETAYENSWNERIATKEIIASLPEDDWYRVEKDYVNVFSTDSLAEGYKGSGSYVGGIEINPSVLNLYQAYNLPQRGNHYLFGSGGNVYFESAAATRYVLTKNDMTFRYGYILKGTHQGISLYENQYAHPLIYFSETEPSPESQKVSFDLSAYLTGYEMNGNIYILGHLPENSVVVVRADFDADTRCTLYLQDRENNYSSIYFMGNSKTLIEIANDQLFSLWFDTSTNRRLKDITFHVVDQDVYYQQYREYSTEARNNVVDLTVVDDNHFYGKTYASGNGYLVTAIPYDRKWKIVLNGEAQETMMLNGGFLGAVVQRGEYDLEVYYAGDSWIRGNIYKTLGLGAFILCFFVLKSKKSKLTDTFEERGGQT